MKPLQLLQQKFIWLLIAVTVLVFSNSLANQLLWDDHAFIINQNHQQFPSITRLLDGSFPVPDTGSYRPVRNAVYAVTLQVFNDNAFAHHAFVLLLHLIIAIQTYALIKLLIKSDHVAQFTALLFALHPLHTESINWVTAGYDLLFVIFYLAAILSHLNQRSQPTQFPPSFLFTALALFTNELALTLPIMIIVIDLAVFKISLKDISAKKTYLTYVLIAVIYWVVRSGFITANPFETQVYPTVLQTIPLASVLLGTYIRQLFAPIDLTPDHFFQSGLTGLYSQNHNLILPPPALNFSQPAIFIPVIISIVWFIALVMSIIKKSSFTLPLVWVPLSLLAVLRVVPLPAIYSERYAYLASIGFIVLIAMSLQWLASQKSVNITKYRVIGYIFLAAYALTSFNANTHWENDYALWNYVLAKNPESASATSALGVQYFLMGDQAKSLEMHRQAVKMNPYVHSFQQNYISSLIKVEAYDEIIQFITMILQTDPGNVNLHTILASTYDAKGDYDNAMRHYQAAYDLLPITSPARQEIEQLVDQLDRKYQPVDLE